MGPLSRDLRTGPGRRHKNVIRPWVKLFIVTVCLLGTCRILGADDRSFDYGRTAYERKDYSAARIYFEDCLNDAASRQYHPDATYYLSKIYFIRADSVDFISWASRFLQGYPYDSRAPEMFDLLIRTFLADRGYTVAAQYVKKYEFLVHDNALMAQLAHGLIEQGERTTAGYALSFCPETDTVRVLRANVTGDLRKRDMIYRSMEGSRRDLYVCENCLAMGDTVEAFVAFRGLSREGLTSDDLYRYAKLCLLFAPERITECTGRLKKTAAFELKARFLEALAGRGPRVLVAARDEDEVELSRLMCAMDSVSREPPEGLALDSMMAAATDTFVLIRDLRARYAGNYLLDSLFCQEALRAGRYAEAAKVVGPYFEYENVRPYVRKTMGYARYASADFRTAATHLILCHGREPYPVYVLAECLSVLGVWSSDLFRQVMVQTSDSTLHMKALRGYLLDRYRANAYEDICSIDPTGFAGDTAMIRIYARGLARCGGLARADSISAEYFGTPDNEARRLYGEYLFSRKRYREAMAYYDSIMMDPSAALHDGLYYDWALAAFYNNTMDIAMERFQYYTAHFKNGPHYHDAMFKIATLNYLIEDYDSAAYYYGLASADSDLNVDALGNELISYKKSGNWLMVIRTGQEILEITGSEDGETVFEIGYASLRAGRMNDAIEHLQTAARLKPNPAYWYWLGEAYLAKADFARAFHSFRRIVEQHGRDEMWAPTALYKTGIVLELLDEVDGARAVYEKIVKDRGINDPIGAEAKARLDMLVE